MREVYIDDDATLGEYLSAVADARSFALDTEFVREKTYFPQLCLLQIADTHSIAGVDCLAGIDLDRLFDRLLREDSEWIVHSSRQDLEIIYQHTGRLPLRLIDTQVAAGLVGFAPQIGLQEILSKVLGIELAKDYTRTDWSRRPLPAAALAYALDDVRSLHALRNALDQKLDELGRRWWLTQDCALLTGQAPTPSPEQIWARLRGLRGLDVAGRAAALALVQWREQRAQSRDRPRRWILGDAELVAIAKRRPDALDALRAIPGLPPRLVERAGPEILAAVTAGEKPAARTTAQALSRDDQPDKDQLRACQSAVKKIAADLGIYPEVLATKQELTELVLGRSPSRIGSTWRADVLRGLIAREP